MHASGTGMLIRAAKCEAKDEARYHKAEAEVEAKAKKICESEAELCEAEAEARCRINYKLLI